MPSEVESPMWTTALQEERRPAAPADRPGRVLPEGEGPVAGLRTALGSRPGLAAALLLADGRPDAGLGGEGRAEPAASEEGPPLGPGAGKAPVRPTHATTSTPAVPAAAATPAPRPGRGSGGPRAPGRNPRG